MQYFGELEGRVKIQMTSKNLQRYYTLKCLIRDLLSNVFVSPKFLLAQVLNISRGRGNETSTNIVWYLYSFRALFVLYEAVLDNKRKYCSISTSYLVGLSDIFILLHIWQNCVRFGAFLPMRTLFIIRNLYLISVQPWTYLLNAVRVLAQRHRKREWTTCHLP